MCLYKSIQNVVLSLFSIFILNMGLMTVSLANEIDEIKKSYPPLLSPSLSVLIYPFQSSPESSDPMNDEITDIESEVSAKKHNLLFDKIMRFNDTWQQLTQKINHKDSSENFKSDKTKDVQTSDQKEINCQSSP